MSNELTIEIDAQGDEALRYRHPDNQMPAVDLPQFGFDGCVVDRGSLLKSPWFIDANQDLNYDLGDRWFRPDRGMPNSVGVGGRYLPKDGERPAHVKILWPSAPEIRFYRTDRPHGYLSNLWKAAIHFEGREFPNSEYAYQFGKPNKPAIADWLMSAPSASLCAQAAHALFGWQIRSDWATVKVDRMRQVLRAKFDQHPDLAQQLIGTGDARLVEESTMDSFWGVGKKGEGKNMLGVLLMEIREELR